MSHIQKFILLFFIFYLPSFSYAKLTGNNSFTIKKKFNIKGNIRVIGNTVLSDPKFKTNNEKNNTNSSIIFEYTDVDYNSSTFNSSSATIEEKENGIDLTQSHIQWAGLYWQGYMNVSDKTSSDNDPYKYLYEDPNPSKEIDNIITNTNVLFKINTGTYIPISATNTAKMGHATYENSTGKKIGNYSYAAYADVTKYLNNKHANAIYTVANLPTRTGQGPYLGNFGAWCLVVVYKNNNPYEKMRNITIFDGYKKVTSGPNYSQTLRFSGFKTPKNAPNGVDSTLSLFISEGDKYIPGDKAIITSQDNATYTLPDADNPKGDIPSENIFASYITGVPKRNPKIINNNGIDILNFQIGTKGGSNKPIKINQMYAALTLSSTGDIYMPIMAAFATELYVPKLCYDFYVTHNDSTIASKGRSIKTLAKKNDTLSFYAAIKNRAGDFDFKHSKLKMHYTPSSQIKFKKGYYSPNTTNKLIPAIYTDDSSGTFPEIAIGHDVTKNGGTISGKERYFSKFEFASNATQMLEGHFDYDINVSLNFGSGLVPTILSTRDGTLEQCPINNAYNPIWASFNVERTDSKNYNASTQKSQRYPLYTQIAGRDFDFSLVSYGGKPDYTTPLALDGVTVEVELIDAGTYHDQNATFTCSNTDPSIVQKTITGTPISRLITFDSNTSRVNLNTPKDTEDLKTQKALRNATFRIWTIVDKDGTIIKHRCNDKADNACFKKNVYDKYLKDYDQKHERFCTTTTKYYQCLHDYFSVATCARDNFAIRPAAYSMAISDSNESDSYDDPSLLIGDNHSTSSAASPVASLAAGYHYVVDTNATLYNSNANVLGYSKTISNTSSTDESAQFTFKGPSSCADTQSKDFTPIFYDGKIFGNEQKEDNKTTLTLAKRSLHQQPNVGVYALHIEDNNWTIVDQHRYPFKTFSKVDDCTVGSNTISQDGNSQSGCQVSSDIDYNSMVYKDMYLKFEPYSFDVSGVSMILPNIYHFVYTNNLENVDDFTLAMSVRLDGNISALSKNGSVTTNFTDTCAASDISYDINHSFNQNNRDINDTNITAKDENHSINVIDFQGNYVDKDLSSTYKETHENSNIAFTIRKNQFENNGTAPIEVHYNISKTNKNFMNPVKAQFISQEVNSTQISLYAHMQNDYNPKGSSILNKEVNFLYARIAPENAAYILPPGTNQVTIPIYLDVYCDLINCSQYDYGYPDFNGTQTTIFQNQAREGNWYVNPEHNSPSGDGSIIDINDTKKTFTTQSSPAVKPIATNIALNQDKQKLRTNVKLSDVAQGYNEAISFSVPPWIDPSETNGIPINNPAGGGWVGSGNTGNVVNTNASQNQNAKRVGW